jgi:predicted TPR repeat methyltransferase
MIWGPAECLAGLSGKTGGPMRIPSQLECDVKRFAKATVLCLAVPLGCGCGCVGGRIQDLTQ